jgi:hypothetical protein
MRHRFAFYNLRNIRERNFYFLKNAKCKTDEEKQQKDSFLYRAYLALNKHSIPLSEISTTGSQPSMLAIRRFAEYLSNTEKRYK